METAEEWINKVLVQCQTPFQELMIVESGTYGKALVLDRRWQTCTGDEFLYHEPLIHTPFVMHGQPRRVLIAGGADGGAAREALKWNDVEEILLVDIDGIAVEACREWLPEIRPRLDRQGREPVSKLQMLLTSSPKLVAGTLSSRI